MGAQEAIEATLVDAGLRECALVGFRQLAGALRSGHDLRSLAAPRFLSAPFAAAHPDAVSAVEGWLSAAPADVVAAELDAFAGAPDLLPALSALRFPIVARAGAADVATPLAKSEAIVSACRGARLEVVAGGSRAGLRGASNHSGSTHALTSFSQG